MVFFAAVILYSGSASRQARVTFSDFVWTRQLAYQSLGSTCEVVVLVTRSCKKFVFIDVAVTRATGTTSSL